ncbi:MAG: hypothetical protein AAFY17_03685 [Cyanobacteria bacterium J06642_11]
MTNQPANNNTLGQLILLSLLEATLTSILSIPFQTNTQTIPPNTCIPESTLPTGSPQLSLLPGETKGNNAAP